MVDEKAFEFACKETHDLTRIVPLREFIDKYEYACAESVTQPVDAHEVGEIIDDALGSPNCSGFDKAGQAVLDYFRPYLRQPENVNAELVKALKFAESVIYSEFCVGYNPDGSSNVALDGYEIIPKALAKAKALRGEPTSQAGA